MWVDEYNIMFVWAGEWYTWKSNYGGKRYGGKRFAAAAAIVPATTKTKRERDDDDDPPLLPTYCSYGRVGSTKNEPSYHGR